MKPRSTTAASSAGDSPAKVLPVLARVPRVGAVDVVEQRVAVGGPALPPLELAPAPPSEVSAAGLPAQVQPSRQTSVDRETKRKSAPSYKVTLASRLFRLHEAIAPHSGFIMAATLFVAGGLLMWINSSNQQEAVGAGNTFAFTDQEAPRGDLQWASNVTQEFAGQSEPQRAEEPSLLQDFAQAETTSRQATEATERGEASLAPLPAPYLEGGYHSTGFGADYLSAIRKDSATEMAKRPVQKAR